MRGGRSRRCGALGPTALLLLLGCAGDLAAIEGGFRHRRHGYSFAAPDASWERASVERAVIAYRRADGATMSLQSRCSGPVAEPAVLARHLRIGLDGYELDQAGPFGVGGHGAWSQILEPRGGGAGPRVKTVTAVAAGCTLDWILVAPAGFGDAEADFDAWVEGAQLPGDPALAGGGRP